MRKNRKETSWRKTTPQGYVYTRDKDGNYISEHRLVMQKKINRKLKKGERVHHIDHNPSNNNPDNLFLCKSMGEHAMIHNFDLFKFNELRRVKKIVNGNIVWEKQ